MPAVPATLRNAGGILYAAFGNPPEAYYRNYWDAVKTGVYGG